MIKSDKARLQKKMTLTVEVSPELESKIEIEAERKGLSKSDFIRVVLEEKLVIEKSKPHLPSKIIATDLPVKDFSATKNWLEKNRDKYNGQYVALAGDTVIAAGFDAQEVSQKARESGIKGLFISFIEGSNRPPFISGGLWCE